MPTRVPLELRIRHHLNSNASETTGNKPISKACSLLTYAMANKRM